MFSGARGDIEDGGMGVFHGDSPSLHAGDAIVETVVAARVGDFGCDGFRERLTHSGRGRSWGGGMSRAGVRWGECLKVEGLSSPCNGGGA
jgi:hypothetical protein